MAMRSIIIALLLALTAFAQEMDTTFFANEQGETFGIIHEKGTLPDTTKKKVSNEASYSFHCNFRSASG